MQNLSTTLCADIKQHNRIVLPAGKAKFLWVDVDDIGRAIAAVLADSTQHKNKAYVITGSELLDFYAVASLLTENLNREIQYISKNPISFYLYKKREGMQPAFILVMIMLHFLPRFQKAPIISGDFQKLTDHKPMRLGKFIEEHKMIWM
jgi:uncharacterized protein YbjT (DUF2867 family)